MRRWMRHVVPASGPRGRRGFTLIEVLVVVVIAALVTGIALPGFVRSMRGAELRAASRTILMSHKYARSTAVLRQTSMAMLLDSEAGVVEIVRMNAPQSADRDKFLDARQTRTVDAAIGGGAAPAADTEEKPTIETDVVRKLGREVKIDSFRSEKGGQVARGVYWIMYHPNGMSDGFELTLTDKDSRAVTITSDAISGKVEAEFGRF